MGMAMQIMLVVLMMVATMAMTGSAQPVSTCASNLIPCQPYLNSTSPPESCCEPLKDALTNDLACLCSIFNSPDILKAFKIDINSALQLPKRCGMPSFTNSLACVKTTAGAPGASIAPPVTPGGNDKNAANDRTLLGLSGAASMFLLWWSIMA